MINDVIEQDVKQLTDRYVMWPVSFFFDRCILAACNPIQETTAELTILYLIVDIMDDIVLNAIYYLNFF